MVRYVRVCWGMVGYGRMLVCVLATEAGRGKLVVAIVSGARPGVRGEGMPPTGSPKTINNANIL